MSDSDQQQVSLRFIYCVNIVVVEYCLLSTRA